MRDIPVDLQARLDGGATTLARCWRVMRRDGVVMGFTNHDATLSFDGVDYEPDSGFTPSAAERTTGLSADTHEVAGALSSERIDPVDIVRGVYDGAEVAVYLVDWNDPSVRLLLSRGLIGGIRQADGRFEAEITGLSDRLSQPFGRAYMANCRARLGDSACGVDLDRPEFRGEGTVMSVAGPQLFRVAGLGAFARDWFTGGRLTWLTGGNAGLEGHVKAHPMAGAGAGTEAVVELWLAPPMVVAPGDRFTILAGCNKTAETCRKKFNNMMNFRGFPYMPGDDAVAGYPETGGAHDGGSLFRR